MFTPCTVHLSTTVCTGLVAMRCGRSQRNKATQCCNVPPRRNGLFRCANLNSQSTQDANTLAALENRNQTLPHVRKTLHTAWRRQPPLHDRVNTLPHAATTSWGPVGEQLVPESSPLLLCRRGRVLQGSLLVFKM